MNAENIKIVEIRDRATCIPAFAIKMLPSESKENYLFRSCGYRNTDNPCILLIPLDTPWHSARNSQEWREPCGRTMPTAHKWIEQNFNDIQNGDIVDVEFILGEVENPCLCAQIEEIDQIISLIEKKEQSNEITKA